MRRKYFQITHKYILKLKSKRTWYILPTQIINFQINFKAKECTDEIHIASLLTLNEFCTASSYNILLTYSHHTLKNIPTLQILSYLSLSFLAIHLLYKMGYLNFFFRPFRLCFDSRPLAPRQHAYQTVNYNATPPAVSLPRSIQTDRHTPLQYA